MFKTTTIFALLFLTMSCDTSTKDKSNTKDQYDSSSESIKNTGLESTLAYNSTNAFWEYKFDTLFKEFKLVRLRHLNKDSLTAQQIENIVNKSWPKFQIKYLKTSLDTIFIGIPNSEILTQQMGTTGAEQFLISTTFSFTELKRIKYVSYKFDAGDHAYPGVYSRSSWGKMIGNFQSPIEIDKLMALNYLETTSSILSKSEIENKGFCKPNKIGFFGHYHFFNKSKSEFSRHMGELIVFTTDNPKNWKQDSNNQSFIEITILNPGISLWNNIKVGTSEKDLKYFIGNNFHYKKGSILYCELGDYSASFTILEDTINKMTVGKYCKGIYNTTSR